MSRWGHRLFEASEDILYAIVVAKDIYKGNHHHFNYILSKAIKTAPDHVLDFYRSEYRLIQDPVVSDNGPSVRELITRHADEDLAMRQKLDGGLGEELLDRYIREENTPCDPLFPAFGKYRLMVLAAVMMQVGATIKPAHLQHLRDILPSIPSRETYTKRPHDIGFRGHGKRQMKMTLDNYDSSKSRDFEEASCHACGKTAQDNGGNALTKCGLCKHPTAAAWFCNEDCRLSLWSVHEQGNCGEPKRRGIALFAAYGKNRALTGAYDGFQV